MSDLPVVVISIPNPAPHVSSLSGRLEAMVELLTGGPPTSFPG